MRDIAAPSRKVVVKAKNLVARDNKALAEVTSKETRTTSNQDASYATGH
jgi:hypothetical protein